MRQIKARVRPARVGHLGTLDPFATGLLPILIGEATKLAPFLQDGEKEYEGIIRLGVETDTLDRTGAETQRAEVPALTAEMLAEAAARFTGKIVQQPPIFSAIKRDGVPLYKLARRGGEVEAAAAARGRDFAPAARCATRYERCGVDPFCRHLLDRHLHALARARRRSCARHRGPSGRTAPAAQRILLRSSRRGRCRKFSTPSPRKIRPG